MPKIVCAIACRNKRKKSGRRRKKKEENFLFSQRQRSVRVITPLPWFLRRKPENNRIFYAIFGQPVNFRQPQLLRNSCLIVCRKWTSDLLSLLHLHIWQWPFSTPLTKKLLFPFFFNSLTSVFSLFLDGRVPPHPRDRIYNFFSFI